jgi:hypothetical protein
MQHTVKRLQSFLTLAAAGPRGFPVEMPASQREAH